MRGYFFAVRYNAKNVLVFSCRGTRHRYAHVAHFERQPQIFSQVPNQRVFYSFVAIQKYQPDNWWGVTLRREFRRFAAAFGIR